MKVLLTHELFPPDIAGGGEKCVYNIVKHLQKRGVDVKVLTTGDPTITEYDGIKTKRLKINRYMMNLAFSDVKKEAKDVDIIHANNYNACFASWAAAKNLNKPIVCTVHGLYGKRWMKMRGFIFGWISRIIEKIQLKRGYDKLIFLSKYSQSWGTEIGIPKERGVVINPGVDTSDFKPQKKEDYILFVGRFAMQKGVYDFIEVAKFLPEYKFKMVGHGEEEANLRKIAPTNVEIITGLQHGQELFDIYGKAKLFFLPSYGETFGFVLVEAMAAGCPIVSTIPLGYEGHVSEPGEVKDMATSIHDIMENDKKLEEMGKKNVELAKKYNWELFTDKLLDLYKSLNRKV